MAWEGTGTGCIAITITWGIGGGGTLTTACSRRRRGEVHRWEGTTGYHQSRALLVHAVWHEGRCIYTPPTIDTSLVREQMEVAGRGDWFRG